MSKPADRPETVVYCGVSLDGFIARPNGGIDWLEMPMDKDDGDLGWAEFTASIDHILMGRNTFELALTVDVWMYDGIPMTVYSTTRKTVPEHLEGKVRCSGLPPRELLADLHEQGVKRVYIDGGATVHSFLREDLVDELVLTTLPVLIGAGIPIFGPVPQDLLWTHQQTKVFKSCFGKNTWLRRRT